MKKILILTLSLVAIFITGCTQKPYVATSPIMSYDLTNVDITTLKSSKVCTTEESRDVSVRHAAEKAGIKTVYGVDNESHWRQQLSGPDILTKQCTIIYGK